MPETESLDGPPLRSLSGVQPLVPYVADLWRRREFTLSLATGSLRAQHLDTTLGNLWHVLNPALLIGVYFLVFGVILGTDRGLVNFVGFLATGIFTFSFAQRTVNSCASSISNNIALIRSLQFPRAVLPMSTVIRELSGYGFAWIVMLLALVLTGEYPRFTWFLAPFVVVLMTMFMTGLGLALARLTDRVRDVANVIPYLFRILFYFSGIIFSVRTFISDSVVDRLGLPLSAAQIRHLLVLDPFFTYIELLRDLLMTTYQAEHPQSAWIAAVVMAPISFIAGLAYFRAGEKAYGRG